MSISRRNRIISDLYTEYGMVRFLGYTVGADSVLLREYGATDEQIKAYYENKKALTVPDDSLESGFYVGYRHGTADKTYYESSLYDPYKDYLKSLVERNSFILNKKHEPEETDAKENIQP